MMQIALFVPGGVDRSGTERVIPALLALIERLTQRHTVFVLALAPALQSARYELLGATVHGVGGGAGWRRRALSVVAEEHRRRRFDVIHAFWAHRPGMMAAIAGWRHRIPVALHLAGGEMVALPEIEYGQRRSARGRLALRLAVAGAQRITAASTPMVDAARSLGINARRIPLGVALDRWPAMAPRPRDPTRPARLLHVADLNRVKDQTTLLEAAALLRQNRIPFRLDIAGYDTRNGAVQKTACQLGLADSVVFHGKLGYPDLHALAACADLHLMASRHEAGPLAVLEAAIVGVPTVGTRVGHLVEWAPTAAIAVPIGDAPALAHATASLLADDAHRMQLATEAHERACAEDADVTTRRFEGLYDEVIATRGRRT